MSNIRRASGEQPPGSDWRLREWLARLRDSLNGILRQIDDWIDTHLLFDEDPHRQYMQWKGTWVPGTFDINDVVWDLGWLAVANKPTSERPAPQEDGDLQIDLPDTPAWTVPEYLGVAWSGHTYTLTQGGWLQAVQVWAPELSGSTNYRILLIDHTDPNNMKVVSINDPILNENDWTFIAIGATTYAIGTVLTVVLDALNSGDSTPVTGGWSRAGDDNNNNPGADGQWNRNTQSTVLRLRKVDLDAGDRTTELMSVIAGSTILITDTGNTASSVTFHVDAAPTDAGTSVVWAVAKEAEGPAGEPPVGADCIIDIDIPTPLSTKYVELPNHWPGNQPSFATATGVLRLGGVDQTVPNNAYGVRLGFQPATVPQDWDIMAYTDLNSQSSMNITDQGTIDEIMDLLGIGN